MRCISLLFASESKAGNSKQIKIRFNSIYTHYNSIIIRNQGFSLQIKIFRKIAISML